MSGARHSLWLGSALLIAAAAVLLLGAGVGSTGFDSVLNARHDPVAWQILWDIRLPRTLGAWVAGGLLGLAGAVAQGLFRNPLADPYLLGSAWARRSAWPWRWPCSAPRRSPRNGPCAWA